jgi:hypothetical protein
MTTHDEALLTEWANSSDHSLQKLTRLLKEERDEAGELARGLLRDMDQDAEEHLGYDTVAYRYPWLKETE